MRPALALLAVLLPALAAAGATEPAGAPLEDSKRALQALQADQAARHVPAGKITDGLPQVDAPVPGAAVLDFAPPEKTERDLKKKKEQQKNWLLNGVDQLDRNARTKTKDSARATKDGAARDTDDDDKPDVTDPDYLLKLYSEQKKEADTKAETRAAATATHADPLAPFLQGWLGSNSPVRGKFFDEFARKPDAAGTPAGSVGPVNSGFGPGVGSPVFTDNNRTVVNAPPAPNPYLQDLDLGSLRDSANDRNGFALAAPALSAAPANAPGALPLDPLPAPRQADKKPLLLAPSDNDKYFPQLKKF